MLTDKQLMFCHQYLIDLNATQAAIRAGYSVNTANEQGSRLLANVSIQLKIAELMQERMKRTEVDADWVLNQFKSIAEDDIKNYINISTDENGGVKLSWKNFSSIDTKNISELSFKEG